MKTFKLLVIMNLLSVFSFFGCAKKPADEIKKVEYGPFTIMMETNYTKSFNLNVGRRVTNSHVNYQILYKGVPVEFAEGLQNNTGYSHLWKVYILENAAKPTLIAGSQSLYLVTEENDKAVVKPIVVQGSDFASLQFLDADNGQPSAAFEVFMDDTAKDIEKLKGGDYLMVSHHNVVHIPDFKLYPFNLNNNDVDNYSFQNYAGAVGFSPDKKWIVFPGSFQTWNTDKVPDYPNALVVYNYIDDKGYTVPIDQTNTRLKDITLINKEWLTTYFEWIKDGNGNFTYQVRKLDKLPFWKGRYIDNGEVFELSPVNEEMQQIVASFMINELKLKKENITEGDEYSSNQINIVDGDLKFTLWYQPEDKSLVLMKNTIDAHDPECLTIIKSIGDKFNAELIQGKYQDNFTSY